MMKNKPQITINVTGCKDCPFLDPHDMDDDFDCNLTPQARIIEHDEMYQAVTPDWCPLETGTALVVK